jgi:transglutaminase-like putative cysteine protease
MIGRRLVYLVIFTGLACAAALSVDRVVQPRITGDLLAVVLIAVTTTLPGLFDRRLATVSAVLLPVAGIALVFLLAPAPPGVAGLPARFAFYREELRFGIQAYAEDVFPLSLTGAPGLRLLVLLWVYVVVAGASFLGLVHDRTLVATGGFFALMAICLTVDDGPGGTAITLVFLVLVVLALLTSQGLTRRSWGPADVLAGVLVGVVSLGAAVGLLTSAPGIAAQGWQDWREWDPLGTGRRSELVFNWRQNYPRLLDQQHDIPLMRVRSSEASYWRANTLEVFTGDAWLSDGSSGQAVGRGPGLLPVPPTAEIPAGTETLQTFDLSDLATNYLFVGGAAEQLRLEVDVPVTQSRGGALRTPKVLGPDFSYQVRAIVPRVKPQDLVDKGRDYPPEVAPDLALSLPTVAEVERMKADGQDWRKAVRRSDPRGAEFLDIYDLNKRVIGKATDPYEVTLRVESYLRTAYQYDLAPPGSRLGSPYAAFLFDTHAGYCQHFAGAMALLLRLNGIPARVAVGFTTGKPLGGNTYLVSSNNAHSWVEVYYPQIGWLPFDPTPGRRLPGVGASATSPGFQDPFRDAVPPSALPATSQAPPESPPSKPPGEKPGATASRPSGGASPAAPLAATGAVIVLLAAAWPFVLRWVRRRGLRRGTIEDRLRASLSLLSAELTSGRLPLSSASTLDETAAMVAAHLEVDLGPVAERAQAVFFGDEEADADVVTRAEALRREVHGRLRQRLGWTWALASAYGYAGLLRRWKAGRAASPQRHRLRLRPPVPEPRR